MGNRAYFPPDNGENWWRDIPGYDGKYRVSREGVVQRVYTSGRVRNMTPYKKKSKPARGRLLVKLTINGKPKEVPLLKVMVETWHGNQDKSLVPYHKNGIVTDNHADNIGFATKSELGRMTGHKARARSVIKVSEDGEEVEIYRSAREAAKANHMSYQAVLDRCHNRVKKPYALDGYTYQFEE